MAEVRAEALLHAALEHDPELVEARHALRDLWTQRRDLARTRRDATEALRAEVQLEVWAAPED